MSVETRTLLPSGTEEIKADLRAKADAIIARYPAGKARSALLPMLHLVQSVDGYVSPEGIAFCAEHLGLTKAEVGAVATFYTMFKRRPVGEYLVSVCTNTMCGVLGGDKAYKALSEHLGVGHDQTTEDGQITLEHAECLAACDYGPVLTVNYEFFDQVDADQALDIAKRLQSGDRPQPTRGARLCSFKETSLQLAGFLDERDGAVADGPAGEPTLAGNRLAERRGVSVPGFDPSTPIKPVPPKVPPADAKPATAPKPAVDRKPAGDTPSAAPTPADVKSSTGAKPAADAAPEKAAPTDGAPAQEEKK
jgi:NADH-quinone oxidoreductase subunit E